MDRGIVRLARTRPAQVLLGADQVAAVPVNRTESRQKTRIIRQVRLQRTKTIQRVNVPILAVQSNGQIPTRL